MKQVHPACPLDCSHPLLPRPCPTASPATPPERWGGRFLYITPNLPLHFQPLLSIHILTFHFYPLLLSLNFVFRDASHQSFPLPLCCCRPVLLAPEALPKSCIFLFIHALHKQGPSCSERSDRKSNPIQFSSHISIYFYIYGDMTIYYCDLYIFLSIYFRLKDVPVSKTKHLRTPQILHPNIIILITH